MRHFRVVISLCLSFLLTACFLGELGSHPKPIKPYIQKWEKTGATPEERAQAWLECGGSASGSFSPHIRDLKKEQRPEEKDHHAAYDRLSRKFDRCMLKKGYRYIGSCSSEVMKKEPVCGAP